MTLKVTVVDDSKSARIMLQRMLQKLSCDTKTFESGEQALGELGDGVNVPDLVFMDHMMPGLDGLETTEKLREIAGYHTLPIFMYTSKEDDAYHEEALLRGANGVLTKPAGVEEVEAILNNIRLLKTTTSGKAVLEPIPLEITVPPQTGLQSSKDRENTAMGSTTVDPALLRDWQEHLHAQAADIENLRKNLASLQQAQVSNTDYLKAPALNDAIQKVLAQQLTMRNQIDEQISKLKSQALELPETAQTQIKRITIAYASKVAEKEGAKAGKVIAETTAANIASELLNTQFKQQQHDTNRLLKKLISATVLFSCISIAALVLGYAGL
jgi:CheY-like chemotaxis protein